MWRRLLAVAVRPLPRACRAGQRRGFAYEDTLAYRLYGPKPHALVLHPVFDARGPKRPWEHIVYDAEEALGLARANRWDLVPGPREPKGGWDEEALDEAEEREELQRLEAAAASALVPEGWHLDRGDEESDDEYDVREEAWRSPTVKRQWAESCVIKLRQIDANTFFGPGKTAELALYVARNPCDFVFINTTLTPNQTRNLEMIFSNSCVAADYQLRREEERKILPGKPIPGVEVLDRNRLILEIFSLRAKTAEAKVQVGIARLEYLKTRLCLGTQGRLRQIMRVLHEHVGPFREVSGAKNNVIVQRHYEVEPFATERLLLREAEQKLKKMNETAKKSRVEQRKGREGVPTIGIVGYTNVGKTSVMNALTGAELKERDLLFETLETTLRRVRLPSGGHAVVADSVGFIQQLPHNLFHAYQVTIEELIHCDILIHVRDISHPARSLHKDVVLKTLRDAGISEEKLHSSVVEVWNKIDLLPAMDYVPPEAIPVCATDGTGVQDLLTILDTVLSTRLQRQRRTVSFPEAHMPEVLAFLHKHGVVDQDTMEVSSAAEGDSSQVSVEAILPQAAWKTWRAMFPVEPQLPPGRKWPYLPPGAGGSRL